MRYRLSFSTAELGRHSLQITGSKSETNRLLILQGLYPKMSIKGASESDDSKVLTKALSDNTVEQIDVHHAGTAMRFLTSYLAIQAGREVVLTGSERMQQRPIGVLVDALRSLGAEITYMSKEGFPPIRITGKRLDKNQVRIQADVSSQYISSLMLIAPALPEGLTILLDGKVTSVPYIKMTVSLLREIGITANFHEQTIQIEPLAAQDMELTESVVVESDWSSASYFYSLVALSKDATIQLQTYLENSRQGDSALAKIYEQLGVSTSFDSDQKSIRLTKNNRQLPELLILNLANTPDLAQTIAVSCFGLGIACELTGLHTLKIKETDRLVALQKELSKLGATCEVTNDSLHLKASDSIQKEVSVDTYQDHRMAMAFAPLALKVPICINQPEVVSKSFPSYWEDLRSLGAIIQEQR
ncbi:MAG: 3-phosphoshikimate 1-carboxyvinyltransferase [Gilvibacter sp.]